MTEEQRTPEAGSEKPAESTETTPTEPSATESAAPPAESATATAEPGAATTTEMPSPEFEPPTPKSEPQYGYWWGTGRRKTSVARVRIREGEGKFVVNKKDVNDFFSRSRDQSDCVAPLEATASRKHIDVFVNVRGGGTTGQAGAIMLGVARALCRFNPEYTQTLRDGNFLTRDSREVERKKYGQRGARRRFQFSKR